MAGQVACERLLWTWNQVTLADTGTGYGPVARSAGWPFKDRADSTGGLGSRTRYLPTEAAALLADHAAPIAVSLTTIREGKLLLHKEFLGEDAFGRNSRWLVHALLDRSNQLHPADALAAEAAGLLNADVPSEGMAIQTDLAPVELSMAPPPVAALDRHEQLLTRLLPGILLVRQEPQHGPVVLWARRSSDIIGLITSLIAVLPRAFSASLSFSTFEARPGQADLELIGAVEPFSTDPRKEPDQLWIDLVENATNLPSPTGDEADVTTELLAAARAGQRPPDGLATFAELLAWARDRIGHRVVAETTSLLQQGISLADDIDPAIIDVVIAQGEGLPEPDRLLWVRQPEVADRASRDWSPMAQTLVLATLRGEGFYLQFATLLSQHPSEVSRLIDDVLERQEIEDVALLKLARGLPVSALPGLFDILVTGGRVHAGFLLFDVLGDPRLTPENVRRTVLVPLLARHWSMLGPAANIPPAVVASLSVVAAEADSDGVDSDEVSRTRAIDDGRPEGLRRWLPGLR